MAYVSLNGVASTGEIDSKLFQFMHPILGSKEAKLAGKILSTAFKATFRVDIDGDEKPDGTVNASIPSINIPDFLRVNKRFTIVFDDLERCELPIQQVMGYINFFIEQQNIKVIVIGNEDEIKDREDYLKIKEKFIESSFDYKEDFNAAYTIFIDEIFKANIKIKKLMNDNTDLTKDIFDKSKHNNLRVLKQSLINFNRFITEIGFKDDDVLMADILKYFLIFSFENKFGNFKNKKVELKSDFDKENNNHKLDLCSKYNIYLFYRLPISLEYWTEVICNNNINKLLINNDLKENYIDPKKNQSAWLRLWYFRNLRNYEFNQLVENIKLRLEKEEINKIGEIKQVIGLLMFFKENEIITIDLDKYINHALNCLANNVFKNYDFKNYKDDYENIRSESNLSYSVYYFGSEGYKFFVQKILTLLENSLAANLKIKSLELLQLLSKDTKAFCTQLSPFTYDGIYCDLEILKYIDVKDFADKLWELNSDSVRKVINVIKERHAHNKNLIHDLEWIHKLSTEFNQRSEIASGVEKYLLKNNFSKPLNMSNT